MRKSLYLRKKIELMQIVTTREFRANQGKFLSAAKNGHTILIRSRLGNFRIVPEAHDLTLTERIGNGLREVKLIQEGKLKNKSVEDLLNEL